MLSAELARLDDSSDPCGSRRYALRSRLAQARARAASEAYLHRWVAVSEHGAWGDNTYLYVRDVAADVNEGSAGLSGVLVELHADPDQHSCGVTMLDGYSLVCRDGLKAADNVPEMLAKACEAMNRFLSGAGLGKELIMDIGTGHSASDVDAPCNTEPRSRYEG